MLRLRELIESELASKDFGNMSVNRLLEAVPKDQKYTELAQGIFFPSIGVIGDWSPEEKQAVRDIMNAREQESTISYGFAKMVTGRDEPVVVANKPAYKVIEKMKPGDIARVYVGDFEYVLAAFPAEPPAKSVVLFVN